MTEGIYQSIIGILGAGALALLLDNIRLRNRLPALERDLARCDKEREDEHRRREALEHEAKDRVEMISAQGVTFLVRDFKTAENLREIKAICPNCYPNVLYMNEFNGPGSAIPDSITVLLKNSQEHFATHLVCNSCGYEIPLFDTTLSKAVERAASILLKK